MRVRCNSIRRSRHRTRTKRINLITSNVMHNMHNMHNMIPILAPRPNTSEAFVFPALTFGLWRAVSVAMLSTMRKSARSGRALVRHENSEQRRRTSRWRWRAHGAPHSAAMPGAISQASARRHFDVASSPGTKACLSARFFPAAKTAACRAFSFGA